MKGKWLRIGRHINGFEHPLGHSHIVAIDRRDEYGAFLGRGEQLVENEIGNAAVFTESRDRQAVDLIEHRRETTATDTDSSSRTRSCASVARS